MKARVGACVDAMNWQHLERALDSGGYAVISKLSTPERCRDISARYPDNASFRSHIHLQRHGFGRGVYKYFRYPLPDLIGEHVIPLQVAVLLAEPGEDFTGGEFVLTEQRPWIQSRAEVVPLTQGEALIFTTQHRPVVATRGSYRVNMRHGVSRVRSGLRRTLGIIFYDAN